MVNSSKGFKEVGKKQGDKRVIENPNRQLTQMPQLSD